MRRQKQHTSFYIRSFKHAHSFYDYENRFVSYLVVNPENKFSPDEAQLLW